LRASARFSFAWFTASSTIKNAAKTASETPVTVGEAKYSIGDVAIPLTVSATANTTGLGLAHYNNEGANKGNPYLTTGYIDDNNVFHDLGYAAAPAEAGTPNLSTFSPTVTKLTDTMTITIDVDWTQWKDAEGAAVTTRAAAAYIEIDDIQYTKTTVLAALAGLTVDVGIKSGTSSAVRFYKTAAASDNSDLGNMAAADKVNTNYAKAASQSLSDIASGAIEVTSPYYYVYGGTDSTKHTANLENQAVDLWVGVGA
jgi:hypothetical protein